MCRNIRTLFNFEPPATELEIRDASLQFVRKLSGFSIPSAGHCRRATQPRHRGCQGKGPVCRTLRKRSVTLSRQLEVPNE